MPYPAPTATSLLLSQVAIDASDSHESSLCRASVTSLRSSYSPVAKIRAVHTTCRSSVSHASPARMSPLRLPYAESHASPGARRNASRAASVAESEGARSNASLATTESPRSNGSGRSPLQIRSAQLVRVRGGASSAPVTPVNNRRGDYGSVRSYSPATSTAYSVHSVSDLDNSALRREIRSSSSRSLSALADYHGISLPQSHSVMSSPAAAARARSAVESSLSRSHTPSQWTQPRSVYSSSHSTSSM
jgi:hypothetical protein